jgi:hypothetical protein
MPKFDHVGIPTEEKHAEEMYVEATKVWVTNPNRHPNSIEFLRFEPDSPVTGPVRNLPHMAFQVENLEAAMEGCEILLGPWAPTDTLRVVFVQRDGAVYEFMELAPGKEWFRKSQV